MKRIWRTAAVAAALALAAGAAHAETPAERAWRNYELLHSGAKKPSDLSDVERRELAAPLFDANMFEVVLGALPLREGLHVRIPTYVFDSENSAGSLSTYLPGGLIQVGVVL